MRHLQCHRLHGIMQIGRQYVGIFLRCTDLGVTQNLGEIFDTHTLGQRPGSECVAQIVPDKVCYFTPV